MKGIFFLNITLVLRHYFFSISLHIYALGFVALFVYKSSFRRYKLIEWASSSKRHEFIYSHKLSVNIRFSQISILYFKYVSNLNLLKLLLLLLYLVTLNYTQRKPFKNQIYNYRFTKYFILIIAYYLLIFMYQVSFYIIPLVFS